MTSFSDQPPWRNSCAISLNAAGRIHHLWMASDLAVRLRHTAITLPDACRGICLHVSVDQKLFKELQQAGLLPALSSIWDSISPYPEVPATRSRGSLFQATPRIWLQRILALTSLSTQHETVLQLDSDNFPCVGWTSLFDTRASRQVQVLSARPVVPFSGSSHDHESPRPLGLPADNRHWSTFQERLLCLLVSRCS